MKAWLSSHCSFVVATVGFLAGVIFLGEDFAIGWITFPFASLSRVTVDGPSFIVGIIAFVLLAVMVHLTGRWSLTWLPASLSSPRTWHWRHTRLVIFATMLLVGMGITLVGAVHQVVWLATRSSAPSLARLREAPPPGISRSLSTIEHESRLKTELKHYGWAVANFEETFKHLPPGGTQNAEGELLHGWIIALGPFAMLSNREVDFSVPWNQPPNDRLYRCQMFMFLNPLQPGPLFDENGFGLTHFAANSHVFPIRLATPEPIDAWSKVPNGLRVREITDGTSNTLLIGTVGQDHKPWGYPANLRDPANGLNRGSGSFGGPPGRRSAHFVMGDTVVREFNEKVDPRVLKALATPNGGEVVSPDTQAMDQ